MEVKKEGGGKVMSQRPQAAAVSRVASSSILQNQKQHGQSLAEQARDAFQDKDWIEGACQRQLIASTKSYALGLSLGGGGEEGGVTHPSFHAASPSGDVIILVTSLPV
jgi:hypothetical protein